jgi:hypothetical protein
MARVGAQPPHVLKSLWDAIVASAEGDLDQVDEQTVDAWLDEQMPVEMMVKRYYTYGESSFELGLLVDHRFVQVAIAKLDATATAMGAIPLPAPTHTPIPTPTPAPIPPTPTPAAPTDGEWQDVKAVTVIHDGKRLIKKVVTDRYFKFGIAVWPETQGAELLPNDFGEHTPRGLKVRITNKDGKPRVVAVVQL